MSEKWIDVLAIIGRTYKPLAIPETYIHSALDLVEQNYLNGIPTLTIDIECNGFIKEYDDVLIKDISFLPFGNN